MGDSKVGLLHDVKATLAGASRPPPLAADASEAAKQSHALHNDAISHLEHAAEALERSIELGGAE